MLSRRYITVLPGDGIGPEVMNATLRVLKKLAPYLLFEELPFGEASGYALTTNTIGSIFANKIAIKGPTATPLGAGHKSLNVQLRRHFNLYANVRPFKTMPNVITRFNDKPIDIVLIRENSEGEYLVTEKESPGKVEATFEFTVPGCLNIATFAFGYAEKHGRKKVHIGHKANIFKRSHGMFRDVALKIAEEYSPGIACSDLIIDNFAMQLVRDPSQFDVMLHTNLLGDIMSDLCAGIVHGSLGFAAGANIGDDHAIFEAVHGTAPDIIGKGVANPAALMLSAALMLEYIEDDSAAEKLRHAIEKTLQDKIVTKDVDRPKGVGTIEWTDAVIERM